MFEIRDYQSTDHDVVWNLHLEALIPTGSRADVKEWDDDLHHIEEVYFSGGGEFIVGYIEDRLVAMGALKMTSKSKAEIKRMRVKPNCQRMGYGEKILLELEKRAREKGYSILHLDTTMQQGAAQKFYLKNGFKEVGRGKFDRFDLIYYEKKSNAVK